MLGGCLLVFWHRSQFLGEGMNEADGRAWPGSLNITDERTVLVN